MRTNVIPYFLLGVMFFGSGFCGLLYQTVWLRLAFGHFGVISAVVSVVISTFMIGLALGSWLAGKYVRAWTAKFRCSALTLYGAVEIIIGMSAFAVPRLLELSARCLTQLGAANSLTYLLASGIGICIAILPWTVAMGMTYPLVLSFIDELKIQNARSFGLLYTANTLGAVAGAVVPVFILIELLGFKNTLMCGAVINCSIALSAFFWGLRHVPSSSLAAANSANAKALETVSAIDILSNADERLGYAILFTTGFCCMAMEVIWVRALSPVLIHSVYAFAFLLACYLIGNAIGASIYSFRKTAGKNICIPTLLAATSISACFPLITSSAPAMSFLCGTSTLAWTIVLPLSISCFAGVLGYLTPNVVDRICRNDPAKVGRAYAVNIIGCTLGPLIAGYFLLPAFGSRWSLILALAPLFALLLLSKGGNLIKLSSVAACAAIILATHGYTWEEGGKLSQGEKRSVYRDYAATTVAVDRNGRKHLLVNGNGMTTMSPITRMMAHLSFVLHKTPPADVLIICFGMGQTFQSALSWNDTKVTVVELIPGVVKAFPYFSKRANQLVQDPRARIIIDDGRRFLSRTNEKFDVILIDPPPPPQQPGSSLLYSKDFYEIIKEHLKPGGIFQHWWGWDKDKLGMMSSMVRSIERSFPYVRVFRAIDDPDKAMGGYHFICSLKPVAVIDSTEFLKRMPISAQVDMQELSRVSDPKKEMVARIKKLLSRECSVNRFLSSDPFLIITDDHPYNEYLFLRIFCNKQYARHESSIGVK